MSLANDFRLYYRGTYVGYRTSGGRVVPFYVDEVSGGGRDYSLESQESLVFHGNVLYDDRSTSRNIELGDGTLVLELPELGYIVRRNAPVWLTYKPVHQASKGLSGRRLVGSALNADVARAIYLAIHEQPDDLARQFFFRGNGELHYKGRIIGTHENGTVTLTAQAAYLHPYVGKAFPNIRDVTVEG